VTLPTPPLSTGQALAGKLRFISETSARFSRLAFDQRLLHANGAAPAALQLRSVEVGARGSADALHVVRLGCDAGLVELLLQASHQPALAMAVAPDGDARLRELAAVALLGPLVDWLHGCGLTGVRALSIDTVVPAEGAPDKQSASSGKLWCAACSSDERVITFTASVLPPTVFHQLQQSLHRSGGAGPLRGGLRCRLSGRLRGALAAGGRVRLATRVLSLPLLQSLAAGDVLLLPCAAHAAEGRPARVSWGATGARQLTLRCWLHEQTITIEGEPVMSDDCDDTDHSSDGGGCAPVLDNLGELDIPLRFELETVAVPLADLEAIQPGYVIELSTPLDMAQLRLVAYGQVIGHAELVVVGDKLGARITRLVTRDERQPAH
jgi:type III secretion protein Q